MVKTKKSDARFNARFEGVDEAITEMKDVTIKNLLGEWKEQQRDVNKKLAEKEDKSVVTALRTEFDGFKKTRNNLKLVTEDRLKTFGDDKFVTQATLKALVKEQCAALFKEKAASGGDSEGKKEEK